MWSELFQTAVIINIFAATIRISTPLLLSAMGELVTERSGVMNLGVEGMMIFGTFTVWMVVFYGGSTMVAIGIAALVGAFLGALLGVLVIYLRVDQTVTGLAMNLMASGVSIYIYRAFNIAGEKSGTELLPSLSIPLLADIPYLGEILFQQSAYTYLAFLSVPVIAWLLRHPARIQPIIGTTNPQRIAASCQADEVELSREEWYWLFEAGRGGALP